MTSAGVNMAASGASDWRPEYRALYPHAACWILQPSTLREDLPVELIEVPTLLLWGDQDPISPVAVGLELERRLPNAKLHVIQGGDHGLAASHAETVAALIQQHLR